MRIVMGIIWFFVIQFMIGVVGGCSITYIQRSQGIPRESVAMPEWFMVFAIIVSLALAIWGTLSEKLPGTKKK